MHKSLNSSEDCNTRVHCHFHSQSPYRIKVIKLNSDFFVAPAQRDEYTIQNALKFYLKGGTSTQVVSKSQNPITAPISDHVSRCCISWISGDCSIHKQVNPILSQVLMTFMSSCRRCSFSKKRFKVLSPAEGRLNNFRSRPIDVLENENIPILPQSPSDYTKEARPSRSLILQLIMATKIRGKPELKRVRKEPEMSFSRNNEHPSFLSHLTIA